MTTFQQKSGPGPSAPTRSPSPSKLKIDGDDLRIKLRQFDRTPFSDVLALFIESHPDAEAIEAFAERAPDKWATAVAQLARIAGFTEKTEINHNVNVNIGKMSDSQLEDKLQRMIQNLGVVDVEFSDVSETTDAPLAQDAQSGKEE